jgi:hypothetical protein
MRVIGFAGWSGTGKTTLIVRLIPELNRRGFRVSTVKHAPGQRNSDSLRHRDKNACARTAQARPRGPISRRASLCSIPRIAVSRLKRGSLIARDCKGKRNEMPRRAKFQIAPHLIFALAQQAMRKLHGSKEIDDGSAAQTSTRGRRASQPDRPPLRCYIMRQKRGGDGAESPAQEK